MRIRGGKGEQSQTGVANLTTVFDCNQAVSCVNANRELPVRPKLLVRCYFPQNPDLAHTHPILVFGCCVISADWRNLAHPIRGNCLSYPIYRLQSPPSLQVFLQITCFTQYLNFS